MLQGIFKNGNKILMINKAHKLTNHNLLINEVTKLVAHRI